jgi:hypothetical protein
MSSKESVASSIIEMVTFFIPHCRDVSTLNELMTMAKDRSQWRKGHDLFDRIRTRTLRADKANDRLLQYQFSFEEICAKTLYNLSGYPARFDDDSPFWVIPIAVAFAHSLGVDDPCSVSSLLRPRNSTQ